MPTDPLQLPLRDIHLPGDVSLWPIAPGWWILAVLVIAGIVLAWFCYNRYRLKKYAAITLARQDLVSVRERLISNDDPKNIINDLSILLRRLTISIFPRTETASLTGRDWLRFLDDAVQEETFATDSGEILIEGPYRPSVSREEVAPLLDLCEKWIVLLEKNPGEPK